MPSIEELVTKYHAKYKERIAADKLAEALKVEETELHQSLINKMREANLTVAGNQYTAFTLRRKVRYQALDWPTVYAYIRTNDAFDLLERRLSQSAVEERGLIPGTEAYEYDYLSRPQKVK
jgi:hypothetical protein